MGKMGSCENIHFNFNSAPNNKGGLKKKCFHVVISKARKKMKKKKNLKTNVFQAREADGIIHLVAH